MSSLRWDDNIAAHAKRALASMKDKYADPTIVVGHTEPHVEIARIAAKMGISVHFIYPNIDAIQPPALEVGTAITVASEGIGNYYTYMTKLVDNVIALDESDPAVLAARKTGTPVWFPITGNIIKGSR